MKILVLSTWFPYPPNNGSKIRAFHLIRALTCQHQVTVLAFVPQNERGPAQQALDRVTEPCEILKVFDDPFRFVGLPQAVKFMSPIPVAYWPSQAMRQAVGRTATASHWDAVVAIQTCTASYSLLLPGVPCILDVDTTLGYRAYHDYRTQTRLTARFRHWISWQKTRGAEARRFRKFDACTLASDLETAYVESLVHGSRGRVVTIANGVDCSGCQPQLSRQPGSRLIYNGALTYDANYDAMRYFLAEIYPLIREKRPDVTLTITGSIAGVCLSDLPLDESVCFSGYVDDIRPLISNATACIVPLRKGGGTRLKILEAMALGTPVVATPKGAEGLAVNDGEHLLVAADPKAFAARTLELLQNVALQTKLAVNARHLVERYYDWRQIGAQFAELVENTVLVSAKKGAEL